jgi:alpha-tubulin suppressor-like RCC1 family protein
MHGGLRLPILTGITQVAAGAYYALALKSDGTVWSWGDNSGGALGDGTTYNESLPEPVPHLTGITRVSSGGLESFAVRSDGTLWTWGCNAFGQLGYGAVTGAVHTPTQVTSLAAVSQFAFGDDNIGTVTWQSPAAGTRVNRGAAVSVRIATAPRPPRECL